MIGFEDMPQSQRRVLGGGGKKKKKRKAPIACKLQPGEEYIQQ